MIEAFIKTVLDEEDFRRIAGDHPAAALALAEMLQRRNRPWEALALCDALLEEDPAQEAAGLFAVRLLAGLGEMALALGRLIDMVDRDLTGEAVQAEITGQIIAAAEIYETLRAQGKIDEALKVCDALIKLRPGRSVLVRAQWELRDMLARSYAADAYQTLRALIGVCLREGDLEAELMARLELHRHPLDSNNRRGVDRVDNVFYAISRLLGADLERVDEDRVQQTRTLLAGLAEIPRHSLEAAETDEENHCARFDRWYRLLLSSLDLDLAFGPPLPTSPPLKTLFALADGTPASGAEIAARARAQTPKAAFFAATSPEYFERYAAAFVRTMLKNADCDAVVVVLLCCPFERFADVIADFPIQDPRLFFGCDGYDGQTAPERVVRATDVEPIVGTHHYAVSALLRLDHLLEPMGIPVFVTGIDTVLQSGIADLLEKFQGCDVVFNKIGSHFGLGGQIVNNLSLTFPTRVGNAFVQFLKTYTGHHLTEIMQPAFLDQLDLHMAKHHVARIEGARLGFFDPLDINNMMFDNDTVAKSLDTIRQYRFVNIFATGCEGNVINPDDL